MKTKPKLLLNDTKPGTDEEQTIVVSRAVLLFRKK